MFNQEEEEEPRSPLGVRVNKVSVRRTPMAYPKVVALDEILLHPLQGADTMLVIEGLNRFN